MPPAPTPDLTAFAAIASEPDPGPLGALFARYLAPEALPAELAAVPGAAPVAAPNFEIALWVDAHTTQIRWLVTSTVELDARLRAAAGTPSMWTLRARVPAGPASAAHFIEHVLRPERRGRPVADSQGEWQVTAWRPDIAQIVSRLRAGATLRDWCPGECDLDGLPIDDDAACVGCQRGWCDVHGSGCDDCDLGTCVEHVDEELEAEEARKIEGAICRAELFEFLLAAWVNVIEPGIPLEVADGDRMAEGLRACAANDNRGPSGVGGEFSGVLAEAANANARPPTGWHIESLCYHVQEMLMDWLRKKRDPSYIQRAVNLAISSAPRSLKSTILACASAWMWLHFPRWRVLCLSANPRVARRDAALVLEIVRSPWYQATFLPDWEITADALELIKNSAGGFRAARGIDSVVTGEGGNAIFVDDPMDADLAGRKAYRDGVWHNWATACYNRVSDPRIDIRICIMQRLDFDDFVGRALKQRAQRWAEVRYAVEYEAAHNFTTLFDRRDPRRRDGEVIHPRFTIDVIAAAKENLGSYGYACQMQQRPYQRDGAKVPRTVWRFFKLDGHEAGTHARPAGCDDTPAFVVKRRPGRLGWDVDWMRISIDAANKKTEQGSQYGILVGAGKNGAPHRFMLDDRTRRGSFVQILAIVEELIKFWRPQKLLIEGQAAGPSIMSAIADKISKGEIKDEHGKPIACSLVDVGTQGDKVARMDAVTPQLEAGWVYLLEGAPWVAAFVDELEKFPAEPNDRGDALSQLLAQERGATSFAAMLNSIKFHRQPSAAA